MTESADAPSGHTPAREVVARANHEGISVRKVATMHGAEAVAVYFSIRSNRDDRCTVRIADAIPEPLRGNEVEFHPKYDPVNWTLADGTAVYAAKIPPDSSRTSVYGIVIDDPGQLELFAAEPSVEITDSRSVGAGGGFSFSGAGSTPADPTEGSEAGDDPTDRSDAPEWLEDAGSDDEPDEETPDGSDQADEPTDVERPSYGPYFGGPGIELDGTEDFGLRPNREGSRDSVVEALVSEVRRRDLTADERAALRKALGVEGADSLEARLDALRAEVETLRDEVAAADRQAADVDRLEGRLESVAESVEAGQRELAETVDELEVAVAREARWRSELRDNLASEPDEE